jgi:hypothetical protein
VTYPTAAARPRNRPARLAFGLWFVVVLLPLGSFVLSLLTADRSGGNMTPLVVLLGTVVIALVVSAFAIVLAIVAACKKDAPRTLAVWALVLNVVFCPVFLLGIVPLGAVQF